MTCTVCMWLTLKEEKRHAGLEARKETYSSVILPAWAEGALVKKADGSAAQTMSGDGRILKLKLKAGETVEIQK